MRRMLPLLLAACATTPVEDDRTYRDEILRGLRAADGDARLVADGRFYLVREDALRPELRAFASALALALETQRTSPDWTPAFVQGSEPVISQPWLDRGLNFRDIQIEGFATDQGPCYWIYFDEDREGSHSRKMVRATAAIDAAWRELAAAARAQAVPTDILGPIGGGALEHEVSIHSLGGGSAQ